MGGGGGGVEDICLSLSVCVCVCACGKGYHELFTRIEIMCENHIFKSLTSYPMCRFPPHEPTATIPIPIPIPYFFPILATLNPSIHPPSHQLPITPSHLPPHSSPASPPTAFTLSHPVGHEQSEYFNEAPQHQWNSESSLYMERAAQSMSPFAPLWTTEPPTWLDTRVLASYR